MRPLTPRSLGETGAAGPLPPTFTISTWNVWFDKHCREERFVGLLEILRRREPAIMAFQEVTLPFVRALQDSDWLRSGYWVSALDPNNLGTVLVSRFEPKSLGWVELPGKMGRRLLVADFAGGLRVGVVHLESLANEAIRQEQLATAFATLKGSPGSILLGDFNFSDGSPEARALSPDFLDAWAAAHPGDPGYTRDTLVNSMARSGRESKRQRLDRILLRGLTLDSIEMIGLSPLREGMYPSDHFGLFSRLSPRLRL